MSFKTVVYPSLSVTHIKDPNRFYAFPIIGFLYKFIILIPVFIELAVLSFVAYILLIINSFIVLFTGKYWPTAYNLQLGVVRLTAKMYLFVSGLTNKYPGFGLKIDDPLIKVDMPMPKNPSRLFAIPVLGGIARFVLIIPFAIYMSIISYGAGVGILASFVPVLFKGRYPESTYELARDHVRLNLASTAYIAGFSDSYPSFWISMNHKTVKWILIIIGAILFFSNLSTDMDRATKYEDNYQYQYDYSPENMNMDSYTDY